jgi:hypothetical protein
MSVFIQPQCFRRTLTVGAHFDLGKDSHDRSLAVTSRSCFRTSGMLNENLCAFTSRYFVSTQQGVEQADRILSVFPLLS